MSEEKNNGSIPGKKYEFTGETKVVFGRTLRRIRATVSFGIVKAGELGGWIEKEENLSQVYGDAWVYGNAQVYGNARVYGDAWVYGDAQVYGDARVYGNARVYGDAQVYGDAWVYGNAQVCGDAWVYGDAQVYGDARVYGDAQVYGNARVYGDAQVCKMEHYLVIGPIGSRCAFATFFRDKDCEVSVSCGCFLGKIPAFLKKVDATHSGSKFAVVYRLAAEMATAQIDCTADEQEVPNERL